VNETSRDSPYLVVDASVSLKWVLDDEDGVVASIALRDDAHRGQIQMVAPSLWLYEVTNALVVAYLKRRVDLQQGSLALALLVDQGVRMADPEPMDCLEIATSFEISGYDAAYLALAETLETELWTGDRRLFEKVRGRSELVRWIGDYETGH